MGRKQVVANKISSDRLAQWHELVSESLFSQEDVGCLEAEDTTIIKQKEIRAEVDMETAGKCLDLTLPMGPYTLDVTDDGQYLLMCGSQGHISMIDLNAYKSSFEIHLNQTVRQAVCLFNQNFWAYAGRRYVGIHDSNGVEIHNLAKELYPRYLSFLPYHALMATWTDKMVLHYRDVSTGSSVASHFTGFASVRAMKPAASTALIYLGDAKSQVHVWTPNFDKPAMSLFVGSPVTSIAPYGERNFAIGCQDTSLRIYDIRKPENYIHKLHAGLFNPISGLDVSQTGLIAASSANKVHVWRDTASGDPKIYLKGRTPKHSTNLKFRPFEDILFCAHQEGMTSMIVPGSGTANPDSLALSNPYATQKQKSKMLVKTLIEKLPAESITLKIGSLKQHSEKLAAF